MSGDEAGAAGIRDVAVMRGNPSDEELAAVSAVLAALVEASAHVDRPRDIVPTHTRWNRTQRPLRGTDSDPWMRYGR